MTDDLTDVPYIGESRAEWLEDIGYETVEDVATADTQRLASEVTGISRYDIEEHIIPNAQEVADIGGDDEPNAGAELEKIPGIGRKVLSICLDAGWETPADLAELDAETLRDEVTFQTKWSYHFHIDKARSIIEHAQRISDDRTVVRRTATHPTGAKNCLVVAGEGSLDDEPASVSMRRLTDAIEAINGQVGTFGVISAETGGNIVSQYTDGTDITARYFPLDAYDDEYARNGAVMSWADDVAIIGSGEPVGLYVWLARNEHTDVAVHHLDE